MVTRRPRIPAANPWRREGGALLGVLGLIGGVALLAGCMKVAIPPAQGAASAPAIAAVPGGAMLPAQRHGASAPSVQASRPATRTPPAGSSARAAALQQLEADDEIERLAAVRRLAELGTMDDIERLLPLLRDSSEPVREAATMTLWSVWSRSGDATIDRRLAEGTRLMSEGDLEPALTVFDRIVQDRPAFAEGWNRRATVLFLLGRDEEALRDCDETLKRNPYHFGALSGMAQLLFRRGEAEQALKTYERALEVNPNLRNGPFVLRLLEEAVRERRAAGSGTT